MALPGSKPGGAVQAAGAVRAKGNARHTRLVWMEIEQDRGISVATSVTAFERGGLYPDPDFRTARRAPGRGSKQNKRV